MGSEAIVAVIALGLSILGLLIRLSVQVGRFLQKMEFVEIRQGAQEQIIDRLDTRMDIIEKKLPLMIVNGSKQ